MSRTTVEIDDQLLSDAMQVTGEPTIKGTIRRSLELVVERSRTEELLALKGSGIVKLTQEDIDNMRANE